MSGGAVLILFPSHGRARVDLLIATVQKLVIDKA
jgi:hypothetical protein